jgi:hypothetical protein
VINRKHTLTDGGALLSFCHLAFPALILLSAKRFPKKKMRTP